MGGTARPGLLLRARRLLSPFGLHRHRVEPDLSALVAFPSCRCGALLWPTPEGEPEPQSGAPCPAEPRRTGRPTG
jgi:hypothetical protein